MAYLKPPWFVAKIFNKFAMATGVGNSETLTVTKRGSGLAQHIPVVVLTTADEHAEIVKLYKMRVSSYIRKPVDFDQFLRVIKDLGHYWFTVVVLPNGSR